MTIVKLNDKNQSKTDLKLVVAKNAKAVSKNKELSKELKQRGFTFEFGKFTLVGNTIVAGTDKLKEVEDWRELSYKALKYASTIFTEDFSISIEDDIKQTDLQFLEGLYLSTYKFDKYKTKKKTQKITVYVSSGDKKTKETITTAQKKVQAQFLVRDLVNTMPEEANSETISKQIKEHFKDVEGVKVKLYKKKDLEKLNMNCHLAVNRASKFEPITVKIEYTPKKVTKNTKHYVIVGKGLTYDSGGLSIKPSAHMTTMKADKGGAMTCFGVADVISQLKGTNKVTFYLGLAENMISSDSYRPDDILTAKNGTTIHIENTDAEGRLVLFDNLVLAQEENKDIDEIYSIATLTGAAVYQFSDFAAGMVGENEDMKHKLKKLGIIEDEIWCNAELHKFMRKFIDDDTADITNTSKGYGMGCQSAGMFLSRAIEEENIKKYLHLDIAGPAFVKEAFGTNPKNATGWGVRSLYELFK